MKKTIISCLITMVITMAITLCISYCISKRVAITMIKQAAIESKKNAFPPIEVYRKNGLFDGGVQIVSKTNETLEVFLIDAKGEKTTYTIEPYQENFINRSDCFSVFGDSGDYLEVGAEGYGRRYTWGKK